MTKVKLCGMFRSEDIDAVVAAKPDCVGFIVDFPKSHRSVSVDELAALCQKLDALRAAATEGAEVLQKVGVFVDKPVEFVAGAVARANLECVQLHGHEDAAYLETLRAKLPENVTVIQAFRVKTPEDVEQAVASPADYVLLDSGQGSGESFDWHLVEGVARPFFLAGGLAPENVAEAIRAVHPFGVDMSSGIETDKLKDPVKMAAAVQAARTIGED